MNDPIIAVTEKIEFVQLLKQPDRRIEVPHSVVHHFPIFVEEG